MAALRDRPEWQFALALPRADAPLASAWWGLLLLRGLLPGAFAIAMGALVAAVHGLAGAADRDALIAPLLWVGALFVIQQIATPLHQAVSKNLGSRAAAYLYDRLTAACVTPPGLAHLEDDALGKDLAMARDFDLGISGPPLSVSMDFIAAGLVEFVAGCAAALLLSFYAWWAPLLLGGAWLATHWLLRESSVWQDRNTEQVRTAQRHADYRYRLAVDAPAAKEVRFFGLAEWTVATFTERRRLLYELRWAATKLRERSMAASILLVVLANALLFAALAQDAVTGALPLGDLVMFASAAIATSMIAFGGLSWALDGAAAPVAATNRLAPAMAERGALAARPATSAASPAAIAAMPRTSVRLRGVRFAYSASAAPVLDGLDLDIPAGSSLAIVGQNGAGKTTLAKLLCGLYEPQAGSIEVDGVDLRALPIDAWRSRLAAVFQDYLRLELSLRDNVAPDGAADDAALRAALADAGAAELAALDTILAKGYVGGTDLSGGQWQRVAIARALYAVRRGAGLVLLDEPTAQLDVRGEAEIFSRVLQATRAVTTILVSHRFSTVRQVDRICVLEHGRVIELGSHDELMARGGRYRTMFELQSARFEDNEQASNDEEVAQ